MSKLERIVHDDSNGLDYILVGEIYLPLIAVPEEKRDIGFYGSLHRNYLKDYKSGLYSYLTLTGKLWTYLADLNEQCVERRDFLMNQIMEQEGITEELKSRDQMEWVRQANNVRSRVDEIILSELVYVKEGLMRYRIEYADGRCCNFASSRKDLLDWLKTLKDEKVVDIRKVYKNGVTDSVIDSYRSYLKQ